MRSVNKLHPEFSQHIFLALVFSILFVYYVGRLSTGTRSISSTEIPQIIS